jgi:hypothetical protein
MGITQKTRWPFDQSGGKQRAGNEHRRPNSTSYRTAIWRILGGDQERGFEQGR